MSTYGVLCKLTGAKRVTYVHGEGWVMPTLQLQLCLVYLRRLA
jgi:hypothetical protein